MIRIYYPLEHEKEEKVKSAAKVLYTPAEKLLLVAVAVYMLKQI